MEVRRLRADEWERWRDFRFAMLADTPSAYGTTTADAQAWTEDQWRERTELMATSDETVLYVTEEAGEWLACAGGFREEAHPVVFAVWTRPEARGRRAAQMAVEAVMDWARRNGATEIHLGVTEGNAAATRLYERLGFTPTGHTEPLRSDSSLTLADWAKPL